MYIFVICISLRFYQRTYIRTYIAGPYAELNVGRYVLFKKNGAFDGAGVRMLKLGGCEGMPPRKILKNRLDLVTFHPLKHH